MNSDTIGFDDQKKLFSSFHKNATLAHAYVFVGPDMIGKHTFALELARQFAGGESDVFSASDRSIETVRNIKSFVATSPYHGGYKVIVINDAHQMKAEAQNALLKILEEPNERSIFLLITSRLDDVLATIQSRCQPIYFSLHDTKAYQALFKHYTVSKEQQDFLMAFTHGKLGLAKDILDQKSGAAVKKMINDLITLAQAPVHKRLAMVEPWSREPELQKRVLYWILYTHMQAQSEPRLYTRLRQLSNVYGVIVHPEYKEINALERFALSL